MQLAVLLTIVAAAAAAPRRLHPPMPKISTGENFIIGGDEIQPHQYPWLVSVQRSDDQTYGHTCGGVYIGNDWILTAAHCMQSA